MLMTFLGMKLKVTQNRRRKGRVCRMLPFPLCITVRRLVTIPTAWGNFAHAHIVITNWLMGCEYFRIYAITLDVIQLCS